MRLTTRILHEPVLDYEQVLLLEADSNKVLSIMSRLEFLDLIKKFEVQSAEYDNALEKLGVVK